MPRATGTSVENSFVKGVVTEFSGFNFPENACIDALNCLFETTGDVTRREGLALEEALTTLSLTYTSTSLFNTYIWKSAGFRSENSFLVIQIDNILHFFTISGEALADQKTAFTFDINTYKTAGRPELYRCDFVNGSGRLFVSNPSTETFALSYDDAADSISSDVVEVKIRDFKVLDDDYTITEGMSVSQSNQKYLYDIKNQGWSQELLDIWTQQQNTVYPTKGQIWWYFRDAQVGLGNSFVNFYPSYRYKFIELGSALAPRGNFLLNAFDQNREEVSGLSGLPSLSSKGARPSCNAFINGRIFLSGVEADGFNGIVYFSNVLKDVDSDIRFFQNGDPTSEAQGQLLANDGGSFVIPEAGKVLRMVPVKNALMLFCTNGVWTVQGSEGVGFTATDFSIERISDEACLPNDSYINVATFPVWWTNEGIFTLQSSNVGTIASASLTDATIQTIIDGIPTSCKREVKASYNSLTKEIYWLYSEDANNPSVYSKVLVLNVKTQAFYFHSVPQVEGIRIVDIISIPSPAYSISLEDVVNSSLSPVLNTALETVESTQFTPYSGTLKQTFRFVVTYDTDKLGFALFSNPNFKDWEDLTVDGIDYVSFFTTGYRVRGEGNRRHTAPLMHLFYKSTANASCYMTPIWDYGNSFDSNRFGTSQQTMKPHDSRFDYGVRRLRIRGSGKAVQFKFESDSNKPFNILGWAVVDSVNERV